MPNCKPHPRATVAHEGSRNQLQALLPPAIDATLNIDTLTRRRKQPAAATAISFNACTPTQLRRHRLVVGYQADEFREPKRNTARTLDRRSGLSIPAITVQRYLELKKP